jgi:hypothetical protein
MWARRSMSVPAIMKEGGDLLAAADAGNIKRGRVHTSIGKERSSTARPRSSASANKAFTRAESRLNTVLSCLQAIHTKQTGIENVYSEEDIPIFKFIWQTL